MKKVAIILPPTVPRLMAHAGSQNAWFELSEKGLLPRPHVIIGASAGAIAGLTYLPWTVDNFRMTNEVYKNLRPKNVSSFPWLMEGLGFLGIIGYLAPLLNFLFNGKEGKKRKIFITSVETGIALISTAALTYLFWNRESVFDNGRLRQLLLERLDCDGIFNSDIRLEMLATDLETGKEKFFTNYRPEDKSRERLVDAALASSSIVGFLPPSKIDGGLQSDGGILSHIPLHRALLHNVDVIVILAYRPLDIVERQAGPFTWSKAVLRASDITETENTVLRLGNFELRRRTGENLPKLFILTTDESLPDLSFRNFNETDNTRAMNIGYKAVYDNLEELREICG